MMQAMRARVQAVLTAIPVRRRPALRRPDAPDALLAADLPLAADAAAVEAFICAVTADGWTVRPRSGWLLLDAPVPAPECAVPEELKGECGCCISLLLRHRESAPAEDFIRAVVKAADAGVQTFERFCGQLHGEFAARLRRRESLPGALLPYLCYAYQSIYK